MGRPWWWAIGLGAVLVFVGLPFRHVDPGRIDDRVLPAASDARRGADSLRHDFYFVDFNPISVVTPWIAPDDGAAVTEFETRLLGLANVHRVDSVQGFVGAGLTIAPTAYNARFRADPADGTWFNVTTWKDPDTHEAERPDTGPPQPSPTRSTRSFGASPSRWASWRSPPWCCCSS